jgi:hypothetical protein
MANWYRRNNSGEGGSQKDKKHGNCYDEDAKESLMVMEAELYLETSARRVERPRQEVLQTVRFVFTSHGEAMDTTMKKVES